ncbi:MAG: phytanoyl-CoA dioxygenase family protein [Pseudomonadota bacterium]
MQTSADDFRETYERDGYAFPIRVMSLDQAANYRAQLEAVEADVAEDKEKSKAIRSFGNLVLPFIDEITKSDAVTGPVSRLLGDDLLVFGVSLFAKDARSTSYVSWHQDLHYWGLDNEEEVTAWIALSPATVTSGCMRFVPGSHTKVLEHADTFHEDNLLTRGQEIAVEVDEKDAVDAVLQPGEMSLHHGRLLHASNPNSSDDRRIGLAIRYISTKQKQAVGGGTMVTLARGTDEYGNFELASAPNKIMGDEEMAVWRRATGAKDQILYRETA